MIAELCGDGDDDDDDDNDDDDDDDEDDDAAVAVAAADDDIDISDDGEWIYTCCDLGTWMRSCTCQSPQNAIHKYQ